MRTNPIVAAALVASVLALTACSKADDSASRDDSADSSAPKAGAPTGPANLGRHDAPGVAFDYLYHFAVPKASIAAVQEEHVRACEQLGVGSCRIIGMKYDADEDDRVAASLSLRIAPDLARTFAHDAISAVEKSKGKLVNAAVNGEDANAKLDETRARLEQIAAHRKVLEGQLARDGLKTEERESLRRELAGLDDEGVTRKLDRVKTEASVATTPMTFDYASAEGFALGGNPLDAAAHASWRGTSTIIWLVTIALATVLPWLVLAAILVFGWRSGPMRKLRRWIAGPRAAVTPPAG